MDTVTIVIIALAVVGVVGLWVLRWRRGYPQDDHMGDRPEGGPTEAPYPTGSRPAGPGAEPMRPVDGGEIAPGPPDDE